MKYLLLVLFLQPFLFFAQLQGKVIYVKDGDTIVILDATNKQHTIRVADIDCPEYKQAFSNKAKNFTETEVSSKNVYIKIKGKDHYGRTIGFVLYNNKNLSEELLKNGLAWHYVRYSSTPSFYAIEKKAKKEKKGLWSLENPIAPWNWRKR